MASIRYTSYKHSILATVLSFLSSIAGIGGLLCTVISLLDGAWEGVLTGLGIMLVFGLGFTALADIIGTRASNVNWWKTVIVKQGLDIRLSISTDLCIQVYNANPCQWTLNKIQAANPAAAQQIQQSIASQAQ